MSQITEYLSLPMLLILLGTILSATGAFLATYKQNQEKAQSAVQRAQFESELRGKSDEIAELNRQISQSVTGGNSFCYVRLSLGPTSSPIVTVIHQGEFPLYDVSIRMWDPNDSQECSCDVSLEEFTKKDLNFNLGNLSPNQVRILGRVTLPEADEKEFALSIGARNGFVLELIKLRRIEGQWKAAYRVTKNEGEGETKILYEQAETGFPLDEQGKVQW